MDTYDQIYLDREIIEAFNADELSSLEIIQLYSEGYISDKLMEEFANYDREETIYNYDNLTESVVKKVLDKIGQIGSIAAGASIGSLVGGPVLGAVAAKASHDGYNSITSFLKKRKEEREKRKNKETETKDKEKHLSKEMHTPSEKSTLNLSNPDSNIKHANDIKTK